MTNEMIEPADDSVVTFNKMFQGKEYTWVALRVGEWWYLTQGLTAEQDARVWRELLKFIDGNVVFIADKWSRIDYS